jgi:hypothetical protein
VSDRWGPVDCKVKRDRLGQLRRLAQVSVLPTRASLRSVVGVTLVGSYVRVGKIRRCETEV